MLFHLESESCSVCLTLVWTRGLSSPWNSTGQNAGGGSLSLLQGLNPGLLHCGQILYQLSQKGKPRILKWVAYVFSRRSSWPRNQTQVFFIAGGFFTNWTIRGAQALILGTIKTSLWVLSKSKNREWLKL